LQGIRVSQADLDKKEDEAISRLTTSDANLTPALEKDLAIFIRDITQNVELSLEDRKLPFPSEKGCVQAASNQGGATHVLRNPRFRKLRGRDDLIERAAESVAAQMCVGMEKPIVGGWASVKTLRPGAIRGHRKLIRMADRLKHRCMRAIIEAEDQKDHATYRRVFSYRSRRSERSRDFFKRKYFVADGRIKSGTQKGPILDYTSYMKSTKGIKPHHTIRSLIVELVEMGMEKARPFYRAKHSYDRQPDLRESFHYAMIDATADVRVLPIATPQGKVRMATTHDSSMVWVTRCLTSVLMPVLKRVGFTKAMLKNKTVKLKNVRDDNCKLYSGDFSKSTDPITNRTSRFVLTEIAKHIDVPEWYADAVAKTCVPMRIFKSANKACQDGTEHHKRTTCGAFMGLGHGWIVLSILNAWCARRAGAPGGSFNICGDDIIGLWDKRTCDRFEDCVDEIGLKMNKSKSFRAPSGVFCERLVTTSRSRRSASGKPCLRIAEACGVNSEAKGDTFACADNCSKAMVNRRLRVISAALSRTRYRSCTSRRAGGTHSQGGGGGGIKADVVTLISYMRSGGLTNTKSGGSSKRLRNLRKFLRTLPTASDQTYDNGGTSVECQEVITILMQADTVKRRSAEQFVGEDTVKSRRKSVKSLLEKRRRGILVELRGFVKAVLVRMGVSPLYIYPLLGERCAPFRQAALTDLLKKKAVVGSVLRGFHCHWWSFIKTEFNTSNYVRTSPVVKRAVKRRLRRGQFGSAINACTRSWKARVSHDSIDSFFVSNLGAEDCMLSLTTLQQSTTQRWNSNCRKTDSADDNSDANSDSTPSAIPAHNCTGPTSH